MLQACLQYLYFSILARVPHLEGWDASKGHLSGHAKYEILEKAPRV